jgi:outer membrane protein
MRTFLILALAVSASGQPLPDMTLRDALDLAATQNPTIEIARLRALEAKANTQIVESARRPQASLQVGTAYQTNNLQGVGLLFPGIPSRIGPFRTFNARPVVTQSVLDLSLLEKVRAARAEEVASKWDIEAAREETQAAVVTLYLQTFQAQSRLRAASARRQAADALLAQIETREAAGAASQLDVARQRQLRQTEELAVIAATTDLRILKPALEELLGSSVAGNLAEPTLGLSAPVSERADILAQQARIDVAKHDVERARRERLPKVSASGDYGLLGAGPDRSIATYTIGATLSIPLWTGRRLEREIEAAQLRVAQADLATRRLRLAAERQRAQAEIQFQEQSRAATAARESATAARTVLELSRLRYEAGLATSVDTVTAQSALAQAEESEIAAHFQAQLALAQLAFARGDIRAAIQ